MTMDRAANSTSAPWWSRDRVTADTAAGDDAGPVVVEPVLSSAQRRRFIELPWTIYRGDPHWIPPLRGNLLRLLNYAPCPFYDDAEIGTFLATRGGHPVGRIAAIVNHAHNRRFDERRGFFGFFECENCDETAAALFTAAEAWLAARGMTAMRGPANPSMNHECGLLVDGFDASPTFMNTYNPPWYAGLFERSGFTRAHDMYAFSGTIDALVKVADRIAPITESCQKRFGIHFRPFRMRSFRQELRLFLDIFNRSFDTLSGFVPLSESELADMARDLRPLMVPELTAIAEMQGKPVGVVFALPDYNPRIKAIDGRLFPFGFLRLLLNKRAITRVRVLSANVVPEYQTFGIGLVLLTSLLPATLRRGVREVEFSWVHESNRVSYSVLDRIGMKITKTYRMYDRDIPPGSR
jgi:GNAT superfamily N-acetyltransferase